MEGAIQAQILMSLIGPLDGFEPHAHDFSSETKLENSFAFLVPCYGIPYPSKIIDSISASLAIGSIL